MTVYGLEEDNGHIKLTPTFDESLTSSYSVTIETIDQNYALHTGLSHDPVDY